MDTGGPWHPLSPLVDFVNFGYDVVLTGDPTGYSVSIEPSQGDGPISLRVSGAKSPLTAIRAAWKALEVISGVEADEYVESP